VPRLLQTLNVQCLDKTLLQCLSGQALHGSFHCTRTLVPVLSVELQPDAESCLYCNYDENIGFLPLVTGVIVMLAGLLLALLTVCSSVWSVGRSVTHLFALLVLTYLIQ
jgi:hypothetical protein